MDRSPGAAEGIGRRRVLMGATAALASGPFVRRVARAQEADLGPYQRARIDWRQAEGERISVAVIPASYFDNLIALTPQFEALTGVKVRYHKIPPEQIRTAAIQDFIARTGTYATSATDYNFYPLYVARRWVDPLDSWLRDASLTDAAWFQYDDLIPACRETNSLGGVPYGIPYHGEVTMQIYRRDLYEAKGLKPADTLDDYLENARALHDPSRRVWGAAMRGFAGVGQNVYIWAPIFRSFGGVWLVEGRVRVNSPEAVAALAWYVKALNTYAPHTARNWNWPDIADAFGQGLLGVYVDDLSSAADLNHPMNSKVIGRIGFARCPKGPAGRRITSIFNWSFPVNAALAPRTKRATWLFISWAASSETQARTTWRFDGPVKRFGANRLSLWRSPDFARAVSANGDSFVDVARAALEEDRDIDARPRLHQWPDIGAAMATAIRAALIGQESPRGSLAAAQAEIDRIMTR